MNDIINKFLLAGDKFMPEMHLRQPLVNQDLHIVLADHLLKTKEEFKSLKKLEIQNLFTKMN